MTEPLPSKNGLVRAAEGILGQGRSLLRVIDSNAHDNNVYAWKDNGGCGASIGMHYRHVLEHFQCLLEGIPKGRINYDERRRSFELETSVEAALAATEDLVAGFRELPAEALHSPCGVAYSVNYMNDDDGAQEVSSTVARELMFCIGHATHHYALMKPHCAEQGIKIPYEFGVAPSTLKHLETHQGR